MKSEKWERYAIISGLIVVGGCFLILPIANRGIYLIDSLIIPFLFGNFMMCGFASLMVGLTSKKEKIEK